MKEKGKKSASFSINAIDKAGKCNFITLTATNCNSGDAPAVGFATIGNPNRFWRVKHYLVSDEYAFISDQGQLN